jgi:NADH-quinone oxidoreductase subunit N
VTGVLAQAGSFQGPDVQWWELSPLLVLVGGGLALLVLAALLPRHWPRGGYAFATCTVAGAAAVLSLFLWDDVQAGDTSGLVANAVSFDGFAVFLTFTLCVAVILTALFLDDYLRRERLDGPEVYGLVLMCAAGGAVMVSANDLIVLFLGLETLSLAMYVLAGSHLRRIRSLEAAIKYFVLGGFSSAFFLYGIALVYGATGSTNMTRIAAFLSQVTLLDDGLLMAGFGLLLVGLLFKVSAVPFHWWAPDVYQGAPSPVTGFMASVGKAAAFGALVRAFVVLFGQYRVDWQPVLWVVAVLTLMVGAILAVVQTDAKRMLAYSSINHAGFMLVAVELGNSEGTAAVAFYLIVYSVMVVGTFGMVAFLGRTANGTHSLDSLRGLSRQRPALTFLFTVLLLSQAGIPFTSGFLAKFNVIAAAVDSDQWPIALVAMLAAVVAAYLYLRIVVSMYLAEPTADEPGRVRVPLSAGVALAVSVAFTVVAGVVPSPVVEFADDAVPSVTAPPPPAP